MRRFSIAFAICIVPGVTLLIVGVGEAVLGDWPAANATARYAFLGAVASLAIASFTLVAIRLRPRVALAVLLPSKLRVEDGDPGAKARALGQGISATMNAALFSVLVTLFCGIMWWIAYRKVSASL